MTTPNASAYPLKPSQGNGPVFGSEAFLDTEDITKTRQTCFQIQLRALSQKSRLSIIVKLEQGCASFYLGLNDARRCNLDQVFAGIGIAESGEKIRT
jgi:hypothetical protein